MQLKDLTGQKFGKLTVLKRAKNTASNKVQWECLCDCGQIKVANSSNLVQKQTQSCGCLFIDAVTRHGLCSNRLYSIWKGIKQRCLNPKGKYWINYGGRGIELCSDWQDFPTFYSWALNNGYTANLTLERIDNNGNYEPSNCKWITRAEQNRNMRSNIMVDGMCLKDYCLLKKLPYKTINGRINTGKWSIERAITQPVISRKQN